MSHPFGDLLTQYLHRKHGLSQAKLAAGILQATSIISEMCQGKRLTGPQARERVTAIVGWLQQQGALTTANDANALLEAAGMAPLQERNASEANLIRSLPAPPDSHRRPALQTQTALRPAPDAVSQHNLPASLTPFIGREGQIAYLVQQLQTHRLLTLTGSGGVGKTRLAIEVARRMCSGFADGVWFVDLAPLVAPEIVPQRILDLWRVPEQPESPPSATLIAYLGSKHLLLVLDNCEHLVGACAALAESILHNCPQVTLLATSREALNIPGETPWRVPSLTRPLASQWQDGWPAAVTDIQTPAELMCFEAAALFIERVQRYWPEFALTTANIAAVAHICSRLDGIPLALEMAAARINVFTVEEIAARLDGALDARFQLLTSGARTALFRHQTLRATLEWSFCLLSPEEQRFLIYLSVFLGSWTAAAAEEVTECSLDLLARVANKSLIVADQQAGQTRYRLLETVRQFAAEQLAKIPAVEMTLQERHCAYYCQLLRQRESNLKGAHQQETLAEIEANRPNVQAAWNWAIAHNRLDRIGEAIESLNCFYHWRAYVHEGEAACRYALKHLTPPTSAAGARLVARLLVWQAVFKRNMGDIEQSEHLLRQCVGILDSPELAHQETRAERAFALVQASYYSSREDARRFRTESLKLYQDLNDDWGIATALHLLGNAVQMLGDYAEAEQHFNASLKIQQRLGNKIGVALALRSLGYSAMDRGYEERAEQLMKESLTIFQQTDNRSEIAYTLHSLSVVLMSIGKFGDSLSAIDHSLTIYRDRGEHWGEMLQQINLSHAMLHLGLYGKARNLASSYLRSQKSSDLARLGQAYTALTMCSLVAGEYGLAQQWIRDSIEIWQRGGYRLFLGQALALSGYTECELGNHLKARQFFSQAVRIGIEHSIVLPLLYAISGTSLLLAGQNKHAESTSIYASIAQRPYIANSHWFADVVGKPLAASAQALPPEVLTAAKTRGSRRNLWETADVLLTILRTSDVNEANKTATLF